MQKTQGVSRQLLALSATLQSGEGLILFSKL